MTVIDAQRVSKQFLLRHNASVELKVRALSLLHRKHRQSVEEFWALRNVSLRIARGEGVGLVGRNGSGKSTLLKLIAAIYRPTLGRLLVARHARICSMIELGIGFHPELTGRENVFLNAAIQGLTTEETEAIYGGIVSYSGLEHFIDVPIKNYSSGMYMRLGFAIAANLDPDVLLLDEIFAVGDADFQQRCVDTLKGFMAQNKTIVFVSHSAPAVQTICRRVCVLDRGELAFDGDVESGLAFYDRLLAQGADSGDVHEDEAEPRPSDESDGGELADEGAESGGGEWLLEFLRREGLEPGHYVLRVSAPDQPDTEDPWPAFLEPHHYLRLTDCADLLELDRSYREFTFAVVESMFPALPFNRLARALADLLRRRLQRTGRVYATWFENPDPADFEPIVHPSGITTYPDREPYHYPFSLVATVCDALGAKVSRAAGPRHPGGESILVISPKR